MNIKSLAAGIVSAGALMALSAMPAFAAGSGYAPSGSTTTTTATGGFSTVLAAQTVSLQGSTIQASAGGSNVTVSVPQGAFSSNEQITLTDSSASSLSGIVPSNDSVVAAFGVNFSGAIPGKPITLTIQNSTIPAGAQVFKVNGSTLVPVTATVTAGKAVISFSSDPDFVVLSPKTAIVPNGTSPVTGVPIGEEVGLGAGLVLLGGVAIALSQRRRAH